MAYNPYYPNYTNGGYAAYPYQNNYQSAPMQQPYITQQQVQPQQQVQQPVQSAQQGVNRSDIIPMMYATYAEATAYRVEPMQKIMFSITDKPLFMLKQADINGRTMVEEYPITPKQATEPAETPIKADLSDFIKRNELDGYVTKERLKSEIKGVTSDFAKQLEELKKIVNKGGNKQ